MSATRMTGGQTWAAVGAVTGMVLAGGYGLVISYATVHSVAVVYDLPHPALFPVGVEGGLVAVLALDLLLTWVRRPIAWLRQVARVLAAAAVGINAYAGWMDHGGFAAILHALPPLLLVVGLEAARHHLLRLVADEDVWRRDPIPRARWLLAPVPTLVLWRRMVLWQISSYEEALDADLDRREIISSLKREFGRRWYREIPADIAYRIRAGVRMDGAIEAARALLADRHGRVLGAADVPGLPPVPDGPDDDGPGGGEHENEDPFLDDIEFARLVAGIDPGNGERERGTGTREQRGEHVPGNAENAGNTVGEQREEHAAGERGTRPGNGVLHAVPALENTAEEHAGNAGTRGRERAENNPGNSTGNAPGNSAENGDHGGLTDAEHAQELAHRAENGDHVDLTIRGIKATCRVGAARAKNIRRLVEEHAAVAA